MPRVSPRGHGNSPNSFDHTIASDVKTHSSSITMQAEQYSPPRGGDQHALSQVRTRTNFGKTRGYIPPDVTHSPGRAPTVRHGSPLRRSTNPFQSTNPFDDDAEEDLIPQKVFRSVRPRRRAAESYISETDESTAFDPSPSTRDDEDDVYQRQDAVVYSGHHHDYQQDIRGDNGYSRQQAALQESRRRRRAKKKVAGLSPRAADVAVRDAPRKTPSPEALPEGMLKTPSPQPEAAPEAKTPSPDPYDHHRQAPSWDEDPHEETTATDETAAGWTGSETPTSAIDSSTAVESTTTGAGYGSTTDQTTTVAGWTAGSETVTSGVAETIISSADDRWEEEEDWNEAAVAEEMEYYSSGTEEPPQVERIVDAMYEEFGLATPKQSTSPKHLASHATSSARHVPAATVKHPVSILKPRSSVSSDARSEDDDDSLFDFEKPERKATFKGAGSIRKSALKTSANRKGRRPRRRVTEFDDEESLDQEYGQVRRKRSSSLQERTQQAWASRYHRSQSSSSEKESSVQFSPDTFHHYSDNDTMITTGTSRSMNSLYTKSPESEAEDLIKDLLLIGSGAASNPGRRKIKFQPAYKRDLKAARKARRAERKSEKMSDRKSEKMSDRKSEKMSDDMTNVTDVTLNTLDNTAAGDTTAVNTEATSRCGRMDASTVGGATDEDPLSTVWGMVEGGFNVVGSALGFVASPEDEKEVPKEKGLPTNIEAPVKKERVSPTAKKSPTMEPPKKEESKQIASPKFDCELDLTIEEPKKEELKQIASPKFDCEPDLTIEEKGSFNGVMDYFFADEPEKNKSQDIMSSPLGSFAANGTPLEEDPRLEEAALHAVRSMHQVHNVVFDESVPIDVMHDIKFSLVKTSLPLGILFHENDGGCWITKVFPDGNAAQAGGVEVGDQLAAINGASAIKLRVDEICTLITEVRDPNNIELTFLRYTGKLHPVPGSEPTKKSDAKETRSIRSSPPHVHSPKRHTSLKSKLSLRHNRPRTTDDIVVAPSLDKQAMPEVEVKAPLHEEHKGSKRFSKWFPRGKKSHV